MAKLIDDENAENAAPRRSTRVTRTQTRVARSRAAGAEPGEPPATRRRTAV
jgi:hypothetical protein